MGASRRLARRAAAVVAAATAALTLTATAAPAAGERGAAPIDLRLIGINDFHGNLEPPTGSSGQVVLADGSRVAAGGAAYLAAHVRQLRAQAPNAMLVGVGDLIGASPLTSALFHDEPTIDLMNQLGMIASPVGNHEFDEGYRELERIQWGGCHPTDGCQFDNPYTGARFPYLGANVTFASSGAPALPPFWISQVQGVPVGFIGEPLKDTPTVVSADAIKDLRFADEVRTANRYADLLDRLGVKTIVLLVHQGDNTEGGGPDDCRTDPGPARAIAEQVSPKIDAVLTAHSHQQYVCWVNDPAGQRRPFLQGLSFGRELSVLDLKIDRRTRDVLRDRTTAFNDVVTRTVAADPDAAALVDRAAQKAAPLANRPVGSVTTDVVRAAAPSGESPLGDVIADAQLAATTSAGAQVALMNPGGVRADLPYHSGTPGVPDGTVTYGEAYAVQPFGNILQTMTLTGAQLKAVLEQQWQPQPGGVTVRVLQPSASLHYRWSAAAPVGSKVSDITVNGQPVRPDASYRVTVNNFLAGGGDGFTALRDGTGVTGGGQDLDAFTGYLGAHPNLVPPPLDRIAVTT
ncbi:bifunctional metallophosphatase/5'-nucleotidase [Gandjariella thermophila]|uniref:Bifunctional metallophosphatase/5'-nucleotidase n=1 Tax=Gandjariella thermophila TaxID=1931992 RepID=A0A4D4J3Z0_9PSEU|nr:bifunctional metallophosphatase/5'-nucleotidase [Gandjariella thermophila]GDY31231.1 bifunctional metallophosphatase/5'-nucleotidase [Gandjariella thermophila]